MTPRGAGRPRHAIVERHRAIPYEKGTFPHTKRIGKDFQGWRAAACSPNAASPPKLTGGVLVNRNETRPAAGSLASQAAAGFAWTLGQTLGSKALGLLGQIVLARLLLPRDFGLVAVSIIAVSFASVIRQTGIQQILVQRHENFRRWANPAFWFELTFGVATAILLAASSPIAAAVFHSRALIGLILVSASAAPLSPWTVVPTARLMIDMRFKQIAIVNMATNAMLTLMSVFLAWWGLGAYSLIIPIPVSGAVRCIWLWRLARPRVRIRPQFRRWRFLVGDSGYMIATGFLNAVMYQAGYLALGLLCTKATVGLFFFGLNLSSQVALLLSQNLGGVLLPALAKLQDDAVRQTAALVRALRLLAFISTPACLLLAVVAAPLIALVYGDKWLPAVPILQIMAVTSAVSIPSAPAVAAMQSQGRFAALFWWTIAQAPVQVGAVFMGAWLGAGVGAAAAWLAFALISSPVTIRLSLRGDSEWGAVFGVYLGPFTAAAAAAMLACAPLDIWPHLRAHSWLCGLSAVALMAAIYPALAWYTCRKEFKQVMTYALAAAAAVRSRLTDGRRPR